MTAQPNITIGQFLGQAERRIDEQGGYTAIVDCTHDEVRLFHTQPGQAPRQISKATLQKGRAGEDVASSLLDDHADEANAADLRFARDVYFPISFR